MANSSTSAVRYKKQDGIPIETFLSESQAPILYQREIIFLAEMAFKSGISEKLRSLPTTDPDLVDFKNNIESLDGSYVYHICHTRFDELFPAESNNQDLKKKFEDLVVIRNDVAHGGIADTRSLNLPSTSSTSPPPAPKKIIHKATTHFFKWNGEAEEVEKGLDFLIQFATALNLNTIVKIKAIKNSFLC